MPFKQHPTDPSKVIYKTSEYWIPKTWQGLTSDEVAQLTIDNLGYPTRLTAAIEAKLKEKNNA